MADAFGLAASIIQVVSTGVQASAYLYGFADTVSSADKALKEISNDISLTTRVLEQLKKVLESEKARDTASAEALSAAEALVKECSSVFDAIVALIKKHFPDLTTDRRKRLKLSFLKWPIIQPKIEVLRLNLEKHKTKLILMTQVLTLAMMAVSQQREIEDQIEHERQKVEALVIVSSRARTVSKTAVNTFGLTEVFSPTTEVSVDIVFVHGLFGHPRSTWTSDDTDVFWPADLLPPILEDDRTRILTYGYESGADSFTDKEERCKVYEVVESLGRDLASNRQIRKATERPLVFVAHSLGGLIVKGVLAHSSKSSHRETPNLRSISLSTYGVAFLATPHNILASHIHLLCETAVQRKMGEISQAMEQLRIKHTALQALNLEFLNIAHEYQHHCFQEMLEPRILDDLCARLSMLHSEATCVRTDHFGICKFSTDSSPGFDVVCAVIQGFVNRAPGVISTRWKGEQTKMQLQNKSSALSKPLIVDEISPRRSGQASCKRQEYRPSAYSCNPQLLRPTPTPMLITENELRTMHKQPSQLVNEAGWEHYDRPSESSFSDPSRLPHQFGTPSNYRRVSTPTAWRGIAPLSRVDNGGVEVGKPLASTPRSDEFPESYLASLPPIPQSIFTSTDENSTSLGRRWPSEGRCDELGDIANARRYDPRIFTPDYARQSVRVFAHGSPASNHEQELHFNNRLHNQPTAALSNSNSSNELNTHLDGGFSPSVIKPTAHIRAYSPRHSHTAPHRNIPGSLTGSALPKDIRSEDDDVEPSPQVNQDELISDILALTGDSTPKGGKTMQPGGIVVGKTASPPSPHHGLARKLELEPRKRRPQPSQVAERIPVLEHSVSANLAGLSQGRVHAYFSQADTFEAKFANAVDQTNSSESAQTFVYGSSPLLHSAWHRLSQSRRTRTTPLINQMNPCSTSAKAEAYHSGEAYSPPRMALQFAGLQSSQRLENSQQDIVIPAGNGSPFRPAWAEDEASGRSAVGFAPEVRDSQRGEKRKLDDVGPINSRNPDLMYYGSAISKDYRITTSNPPSPISNRTTGGNPGQTRPIAHTSIHTAPRAMVNSSAIANCQFTPQTFYVSPRRALESSPTPQATTCAYSSIQQTAVSPQIRVQQQVVQHSQPPPLLAESRRQRHGASSKNQPSQGDRVLLPRVSSISYINTPRQLEERKPDNPPPSTPEISTPSTTPNLQDLHATQEEQARAKEEVLKLLRQWTTVDVSRFVGSKGSARDVNDGVQTATVVC